MIQLRDKFFGGNLNLSSSASVESALGAVAPKRDSVMCRCSYSHMMKLIDDKKIFRNFIGMLGRCAECYADVVHLHRVRNNIGVVHGSRRSQPF